MGTPQVMALMSYCISFFMPVARTVSPQPRHHGYSWLLRKEAEVSKTCMTLKELNTQPVVIVALDINNDSYILSFLNKAYRLNLSLGRRVVAVLRCKVT